MSTCDLTKTHSYAAEGRPVDRVLREILGGIRWHHQLQFGEIRFDSLQFENEPKPRQLLMKSAIRRKIK